MPSDVWDELTAQDYDSPGEGMFAPDVLGPTVDRLADLAAGGAALEFAIGTGRVGIALQQAGVAVTGIELSEPMIAQLRTKVDEATLPVTQGDMATARVPGGFSLVFLVYNTIMNLQTQDEQVSCFANAAAHLGAGGCFVVEVGVPDLRALPHGRDGVVFGRHAGYLGVDTYDVVNQHLISHHVSFGAGRDATIGRGLYRYVWPAELDLMARIAGFALESRHADWSGADFTAESESHVSVYRLR